MLTVGKEGSIIEKLREMLEEYMKRNEPEYYPPVENLLDLIYEHYNREQPGGTKDHSGRQSSQGKRERDGEMAAWAGWYGKVGRGLRRPDSALGEDHGPAGERVLCLGEDCF